MFTQLLIALYEIPVALAQQLDGNPPPVGGGFELYDPLGCGGAGDGGLLCVFTNVLRALRLISIPIVSIMVIVGGFQILTASGEEEKIKTGRRTITWAVVGFAVILIAEGVAGIVKSVVSP